MTTTQEIFQWMQSFAPLDSAAEWDNVGMLLGSQTRPVKRVMTCLTLSHEVALEAARENADLIITHHPMMLKGIKGITDVTPEGRSISLLLQKDIAVYSPHTAFDNCAGGINDMLAGLIELKDATHLRQRFIRGKNVGEGRLGLLGKPSSLRQMAELLKLRLNCNSIAIVGALDLKISKIAIVCGAGGDFIPDAIRKGADLFITGEMRFHDAVMAKDSRLALLLPGHFATERLGIESLCSLLQKPFPDLRIWASKADTDPISVL